MAVGVLRGGCGHRRGPASALASLAQFARASAFPVFLPSADCSLLMSMAPEDGQLIRLSDAAMFGAPFASGGLGAHVFIVARVLRDVKGGGGVNWDFKDFE